MNLGKACESRLANDGVTLLCRTRDLVGKLAASEAIGSLLADNHLPYTIVEDEQRKTVSLKTHTGELLSAEALVVSAPLHISCSS